MKTSFVCLLLLGYMGAFYFSNKHLPLKSTRIFRHYYISAFILVVFDLITLYTVNHMDVVPVAVNSIAHIIYLLSINATVYLNFLYLRSLLENQLKIAGWIRRGQSTPFAIASILILILPLGYVEGAYTNYSMGAKVYALYVSIILYNFFILYYCIRYWKLLNREKRAAIIASVPIFFGVTVINITMPEALFSIVYVILTAVGLMMSNENSEKYIDKQTDMFNAYALEIVNNEYINLKKDVSEVVITMSESENVQDTIDWKQYITLMKQIQVYCRKEKKRQAYRVGDNGFVLLVNSNQTAEKLANEIIEYASGQCRGDIALGYKVIALNECASSDDLMSKIAGACMNAINKMAVYDFLTGVRNRNAFEKELAHLKNKGMDAYYFIADLNNLKETNDALGHSAGDELLQTVARLLKDVAGNNGMVYRQGGDEFAVLWRGEQADAFLEMLEEKRIQLNKERVVPVSFAIGYGRISEEDGIEKADRMMYENKRRMKETSFYKSPSSAL
ncbi:MAG: GGDEF domain-containing protein [Roseburia sp.]